MKKIFSKWFLFLIFAISCQPKQEWSYPFLFWGFAIDGFPITQKLYDLQSETQVNPEMIVFYLQWSDDLIQQDEIIPSLDAIWDLGGVPCLTWEPMSKTNQIERMIPYEEILNGKYDPYLTSMANEIRNWEKPVLIRFAQEMNIERYHWGTSKNDFGPDSSEIYIQMFRYIVDLFRGLNANNVFWVFCPNVDSIPNEPWNAAKLYYPGDQYVDIFGMDGYNWNINEKLASVRKQPWTAPWRSFEKIFEELYKELKAINTYKPIIVFETASVTRTGDAAKSLWIKDAIGAAKKWGIKGIVWFQVNKEEDWRINQNDDYSYLPFIQHPPLSFQSWLLDYSRLRQRL